MHIIITIMVVVVKVLESVPPDAGCTVSLATTELLIVVLGTTVEDKDEVIATVLLATEPPIIHSGTVHPLSHRH